jgi:hypothetical protein
MLWTRTLRAPPGGSRSSNGSPYNDARLHGALGDIPPVGCEALYAPHTQVTTFLAQQGKTNQPVKVGTAQV